MANNPGYWRIQQAHKGLWSPYLLTPSILKAWWCADDLSAASVTTWTDRCNAIALTAAGSAIPTWANNSWTGSKSQAGVTFDGVANCVVGTTLTALPTAAVAGEMWCLIVNNVPGSTSGTFVIARYGGTGASSGRSLQRTQGGDNHGCATVSDLTAALIDSATNHVNLDGAHFFGANWSGTTLLGQVDGNPFTPANTATIASLNTGTTRIRIGANNAGAAALFFQGVVRHVFITTTLTTLQRQQLEGYLAWDGWTDGLTDPLPASHPYKNARP